jgi:RNA polymerase sigma-70 factor, ECF subfamily
MELLKLRKPGTLHFAPMNTESGDEAGDEDLMLRYCAGDASAFEALYRRHRGPVYRYLLRQCGNAGTAEELFQDVWLRVVNARIGYEVKARFTTWLYRIAHNRLMDYFRSHARARLESYDALVDDESSDEQWADVDSGAESTYESADVTLDRKRTAERLVAAIDTLPAAQREAFLLREEGGLSLEEIAAATGVNAETAKSRLRYAMARLRSLLKELP